MSLTEENLSRIASRSFSLLVETQLGQCILLQLIVSLSLQADFVLDIMAKHPSASASLLPPPTPLATTTAALLSLVPCFTCFHPSLPTAKVTAQNVQIFTAFFFAFYSKHFPTFLLTQLHGFQDSARRKLKKENKAPREAFTEHRTEGWEAWVTAITVAHESLQREKIELRSENDGLKEGKENPMH